MKDLQNMAKIGKEQIAERRDLYAGDIMQLFDIYREAEKPADGVWNVITIAFYAGVTTGLRQAGKRC